MTRGVGGRGDGWHRGGEGKQTGTYAMKKSRRVMKERVRRVVLGGCGGGRLCCGDGGKSLWRGWKEDG